MRSSPLHDVGEIQQALAQDGLDAAVVVSPRNVWCLTGYPRWRGQRPGYRRNACAIGFRDREPVLVAGRYSEEISLVQAWARDVTSYADYVESPLAKAAEVLRRRGLASGRIGIESRFLTAQFFGELAGGLDRPEIVPWDDGLDAVWNAKRPAELDIMRQNLERLGAAVAGALEMSRAGDSEETIHRRIRSAIRAAGSGDGWGRVSAGARIGLAGAPSGTQPLDPGTLVRVEYGCTFRTYPAKVTRMAAVGPTSASQVEKYGRYLAAVKQAVGGIGPGQAGQEVTRQVAASLQRSGFELKGPLAGHGLGIGFVERPRLHSNETFRIVPHSVLCIEPETVDGYKVSLEAEITETGWSPFSCASLSADHLAPVSVSSQ